MSPVTRQAYAPSPRVRLGWAQGEIAVGEVRIEPSLGVAPTDGLAMVAARLRDEDSNFVPVVSDGRLRGVVFIDEVLRCLAEGEPAPVVEQLSSTNIPTCTPNSVLVDAVRQMVACYLTRIPVVDGDGRLLGMLTLAGAAAAAMRDPAVRDVLESTARGPALFARRWR